MKKLLLVTSFALVFIAPVSIFAQSKFGGTPGYNDPVNVEARNNITNSAPLGTASPSNSSGGGISTGCSNITSLDGVVSCVSGFFNSAIYLLMSFALLYTVWSALQFIRADGENRDEWRSKIVAGIIGLFVMASIWGLVNILTGTFGLNNSPVSPTPIKISK